MRKIKTYKLFLESNEFDFDFLAAIGKMKLAILKIVELHEVVCYGEKKLSSYDRFKASINDLINRAIETSPDNKEHFYTITEDYLSVIGLFEKEVYKDNKLSEFDQSLFSSLDDLVGLFNLTLDEKAEDDIKRLEADCENILTNMTVEWVHKNEEEGGSEINTDVIDDVIDGLEKKLSEENDGMWDSEEEFQKDIEDYIGKKMEDFDYSDKLSAYKWIENKDFVKRILQHGSESDKEYIKNFLSHMKDLFEL
jgi:hypothetical protein